MGTRITPTVLHAPRTVEAGTSLHTAACPYCGRGHAVRQEGQVRCPCGAWLYLDESAPPPAEPVAAQEAETPPAEPATATTTEP